MIESFDVSTNDLTIVMAAQSILTRSALPNVKAVPKITVTVPHTYNSVSNSFTVFDRIIAQTYGATLATLSISVDAIFQTNYYWFPGISGVMDSSTSLDFQPFDQTVNVFDAVPTAKSFLLPPGASVTIKAYNNVSTNTQDGHVSVYATYSQLTAAEAAVLRKYKAILDKIAMV